jgi:hypothetical protein
MIESGFFSARRRIQHVSHLGIIFRLPEGITPCRHFYEWYSMPFAGQGQEQADVEGIAGEAGSGLYF